MANQQTTANSDLHSMRKESNVACHPFPGGHFGNFTNNNIHEYYATMQIIEVGDTSFATTHQLLSTKATTALQQLRIVVIVAVMSVSADKS